MEITKREIKTHKERRFPEKIRFKPIGFISTPFKSLKGIPVQFSKSEAEGCIQIEPKYASGLRDLDGFSHIYCIYYFDMVRLPVPLVVKPFLDDEKRDIFATRSPFRPNPIGISILEILEIKDNKIHVKNVDILDDTPILDIKPYISQFDFVQSNKIGWLNGKIMR